jgi:uncharacterized protein YqgC (DUF456 family)
MTEEGGICHAGTRAKRASALEAAALALLCSLAGFLLGYFIFVTAAVFLLPFAASIVAGWLFDLLFAIWIWRAVYKHLRQ